MVPVEHLKSAILMLINFFFKKKKLLHTNLYQRKNIMNLIENPPWQTTTDPKNLIT